MKKVDVIVWLKGQVSPIKAGTFGWNENTQIGQFSYDTAYLETSGCFPLDPIKLPLSKKSFKEIRQKGIFNALLDSGPGYWGQKILESRLGTINALDFLIESKPDSVGALSLSRHYTSETYLSLEQVNQASMRYSQKTGPVQEEKSITEEQAEIALDMNCETSLGGAKPKVTVYSIDFEQSFQRIEQSFQC